MPSEAILRRIDTRRDDARAVIDTLRRQLSPEGDVVTPEGRARTVSVFGEPLSPQQVVERICRDVRERGRAALLEYTKKLDGVALEPATIRVGHEELNTALRGADPRFLATLRRVRENVLAYQRGVLHHDVTLLRSPGMELGLRYRPLRRVGICIPGGAAAYPSSIMMTVVPAQAAGVTEIAVVVPPTRFGGFNEDVLATCRLLGVSEVYRVGGAQAVAALAYGVEGIDPVDKVVGPGNIFVALAKKKVYGTVDIDCIAGPSEVVLIADGTADPRYVARDLLSQAEHAPGASILITWEETLAEEVERALEEQLARLSRANLARESLERFGAVILVRDADEAVAISNEIAPEHLHVSTANPDELGDRIENAGAIFLGHDCPVALGDYAAGPSHVLPTGGTARWASGLAANDFLRRTSLIKIDRRGLEALAEDVCVLAETEGLTAHRASVEIRLRNRDRQPER
jgi:histidinol dehydrogenase